MNQDRVPLLNEDYLERAKKKQITDTSHLNFSVPLRESTPILNEDEDAIEVDEHYDKSSDDAKNKSMLSSSVNKLKKTIEFLRCLLKAKDDIIQERETEKCFLQNKNDNLEALLISKDETVKKLTNKVEDLTKFAEAIQTDHEEPKTTSTETETGTEKSKSNQVVSTVVNARAPDEKKRKEKKRR